MKKSFCFFLILLIVLLSTLSACSDTGLEKLKEAGDGFYCDETLYSPTASKVWSWIVLCEDELVFYDETSHFLGLGRFSDRYCTAFDDRLIALYDDVNSPEDCWGKVSSNGLWFTEELSAELTDFLEGTYSSYRILSPETDCYYSVGETLQTGSGYLSNIDLKHKMSPSYAMFVDGYSVLGCDPSGSLGWVVGKIISEGGSYYYYPIDPSSTNDIVGRKLSDKGVKAFEGFLENTSPVKPTITVRNCLADLLREERLDRLFWILVPTVVGALLLLTVLIVLLRRKIARLFKGLWRCFVHRAKDSGEWAQDHLFDVRKESVYEEDLKPLNLTLTKEDYARSSFESPEQETHDEEDAEQRSLNRQFCPACGARCDWTSLRCATCGAELKIHGKTLVKIDPINAPSRNNGKAQATVLDVDSVPFSEYLSSYAPVHLRKSTARFSVWYFVLSVLAFFSSLLVYGDLLLLTQSEAVSLLSLLPGGALLVFAILYRLRRGLGYSIVFAVYSVLLVLSSVVTLASAPSLGALTTGNPLDSIIYIIVVVIECVLYLLSSGLGLYRTVQLRAAYRDFKQGKTYHVQ